ncbi:transposase [Lentzea tibetensis]|uniref:transposase n=1 Tax=Lentzea tibetensis TaxID=2591470 RepID=UPI0038B3E102
MLADVGDVTRFATRDRFASWNGTAPLDASSGQQLGHRLSHAGNRRINRTLHIMAPSSCATPPRAGPTSRQGRPRARPRWRPCAHSNDDCPMWSTSGWCVIRGPAMRQAREGTRGRLCNPS